MMILSISYKPILHFSAVFFCCCLMGLATTPSFAVPANEHQQVRQYMQEILQQQAFQTRKTVTEWRYINDKQEAKSSENRFTDLPTELLRRLFNASTDEQTPEESSWFHLPRSVLLWLAQFAELLLWVFLLLGVLALLWALYRNANWRIQRQKNSQPNTQLSELEMILHKTQGLPDHPAQAAWLYWQQGQARVAISLLYRASLEHLRQHEGLPLPDSATEGECLRLIKRTQAMIRSNYCTRLTQTWQALAYAHQLPNETAVRSLCDDWDTQFLNIQKIS